MSFSAANGLSLTRPPAPGWKKTLRPPSRGSKGILGLPAELLQGILNMAVPRHSRYDLSGRVTHYRHFLSLIRTCRLFHRLTMPMMYSSLIFHVGADKTDPYCDKWSAEVMRKLLRSYQENPHLGEYCEKLDIRFNHPRDMGSDHWEHLSIPDVPLDENAEVDIEVVTGLASLLRGTKSIRFSGEIRRYEDIWIILGIASANMPKLEVVELSQLDYPIEGPICDSLCAAGTLKYLQVMGISEISGAMAEVKKASLSSFPLLFPSPYTHFYSFDSFCLASSPYLVLASCLQPLIAASSQRERTFSD